MGFSFSFLNSNSIFLLINLEVVKRPLYAINCRSGNLKIILFLTLWDHSVNLLADFCPAIQYASGQCYTMTVHLGRWRMIFALTLAGTVLGNGTGKLPLLSGGCLSHLLELQRKTNIESDPYQWPWIEQCVEVAS